MNDMDDDNSVTGAGELKGDKQHVDYLSGLIRDAKTLSSQSEHLDIIIKNGKKKPIEYKVRKTSTTNTIGKGFIDTLIKTIKDSTDVRTYDATYSFPKGTIQVLASSATPHLRDVASQIARPNNQTLQLSEFKKERGIVAFAFSESVGGYNFTIWGRMTSSKVLDPAKWFVISTKEGKFESISDRFILAIPNRIDALSDSNNVYIFDHSNFESIFEFKEGFIANIEKNKHKLNLLVSKPEELVASCTKRVDTTRKLYGILSNLEQRKLTPEVAKRTTKQYKLNINFDSRGLIDISTSSLPDIIKLLDDDLVKSAQNPRRRYITHGKTPA